MRKVQGLAGFAWKLGVTCILCIPWSLQAEIPKKNSADHSVAKTEATEYEEPKADVNPTLAKFQEKFSAMGDRGLLEFISKLSEMATLNPESFDALVDALPELAEPAAKDEALKEELKAEFRAGASELGADAKSPLLKVAKDEAEARFKKPGSKPTQNPADFQKILDEKLAELKKKDEETSKNLAKELEEKNKQLQELIAKNAELNKTPNDQALDPNALAGLGQGQGAGAGDQGAGSGDSGSGSGSGGSGDGGGGKSGGGDKSGVGDKAKPENKANNAFNDFAKALDSKPEETKSASAPKDGSSSTPRAKSSLADEDNKTALTGPDASGAGNANPILADAPASASKPGKLGQLGSKSSLSSIPSDPGAGSGANTAQAGGGPVGGGGSPMMGGGGGSAYGGGGSGGSFPFASPGGGGPAGDQKFEYSRDAKYGASGGGDGGGSSFEGNEEIMESGPALGAVGGTLVNASRARARGVSIAEPAFMGAVNQMLGGLCANGNLDCNRTKRKPASGRK